MKKSIVPLLHRYKYEILLAALLQHLFIGLFMADMAFYTRFIFPVNMLILGVASIGVFTEKSRWKRTLKNLLLIPVIYFPMSLPFWGKNEVHMLALSLSFCLFYTYIFVEVLRFLIRPSYINRDIIVGSLCGYFLLIEIMVFLLQAFYYTMPGAFKGIDHAFSLENAALIFIDLLYFSTITITSIGFGDIVPNNHYTKLITALFGVTGQLYSVVLVGLLISKFSSRVR